jgi:hypothetical protein
MEGVYEEGYFVSMKYRPQNVDSYNWKFFHIFIITGMNPKASFGNYSAREIPMIMPTTKNLSKRSMPRKAISGNTGLWKIVKFGFLFSSGKYTTANVCIHLPDTDRRWLKIYFGLFIRKIT